MDLVTDRGGRGRPVGSERGVPGRVLGADGGQGNDFRDRVEGGAVGRSVGHDRQGLGRNSDGRKCGVGGKESRNGHEGLGGRALGTGRE